MCGELNPSYVCSTHAGTVFDWRWWVEVDPAEVDADRREALRVENHAPEPGITRTTR